MATKEQAKAALMGVAALVEAIRELKQVPNGVLYAHVMPHMSFESYERSVALLKRTGLVEEQFHVLHWRGPVLATTKGATV